MVCKAPFNTDWVATLVTHKPSSRLALTASAALRAAPAARMPLLPPLYMTQSHLLRQARAWSACSCTPSAASRAASRCTSSAAPASSLRTPSACHARASSAPAQPCTSARQDVSSLLPSRLLDRPRQLPAHALGLPCARFLTTRVILHLSLPGRKLTTPLRLLGRPRQLPAHALRLRRKCICRARQNNLQTAMLPCCFRPWQCCHSLV